MFFVIWSGVIWNLKNLEMTIFALQMQKCYLQNAPSMQLQETHIMLSVFDKVLPPTLARDILRL